MQTKKNSAYMLSLHVDVGVRLKKIKENLRALNPDKKITIAYTLSMLMDLFCDMDEENQLELIRGTNKRKKGPDTITACCAIATTDKEVLMRIRELRKDIASKHSSGSMTHSDVLTMLMDIYESKI